MQKLFHVPFPTRLRTKLEYLFIIHTFKHALGNIDGVIMVLFIRITAHPMMILKKHCHSIYDALNILFKARFTLKILMSTIHNILIFHVCTVHYSYGCRFLLIIHISSNESKVVEDHSSCQI